MDEFRRRTDDAQPATRGELRRLEKRVETLEELRPKLDELAHEFRGLGAAVQRHIEQALPVAIETALRPHTAKLDRLDDVAAVVEKAHAILLEQEVRAKVVAEQRAKAEEEEVKREAARTRFWTRVAIFVPVMVALIGLISAAIVSQQKSSSQSATQSAPK